MIRYLLLIAALAHPAILIGDKPCLWKRAVTRTTWVQSDEIDTLWLNKNGWWGMNAKPKDVKIFETEPRRIPWVDTTGWETYWDSCPRGK